MRSRAKFLYDLISLCTLVVQQRFVLVIKSEMINLDVPLSHLFFFERERILMMQKGVHLNLFSIQNKYNS